MNFEEKLKMQKYDQLWQEYCGFLDLSMADYMHIQNRLMLEQIDFWSQSPLGQQMLKGKHPQSIQDFCRQLPLTTYEDYADILLQKQEDMLPGTPIVWIQTTWEGGKHPLKVAPYTQGMLESYKNNVMSCFMLGTSNGRGQCNISPHDKMLYGLAPLPYATGLLPLLLNEEISLEYLPPVEQAQSMSFSERNKKGFQLGIQKDINLFFGLSSVAYYISKNLAGMVNKKRSSKIKSLLKMSPRIALRSLLAAYRCRRDEVDLKPKDIFKLKGFVCAGTDSSCYKDALEDLWGLRPLEIAAGTETTCLGTETWARNGLYFFPDACFYEFIPESEMKLNLANPNYTPRTYFMNEVVPHQNYELVVTVLKGGAFARYRVGDVYRCLGVDPEQSALPRFAYLDRVPTVIDIAGFTRITEACIVDVIRLSGLPIAGWVAAKEYTCDNMPFLHMYVEICEGVQDTQALNKQVLTEHLSVYFKYFDSDYHDLKKLLGIEPLVVTILKEGTFAAYSKHFDKNIEPINPARHEVIELLKIQQQDYELSKDSCKGVSYF